MRPEDLDEALARDFRDIVTEAATDLLEVIQHEAVSTTPKLTGHHAASWQPFAGSPDDVEPLPENTTTPAGPAAVAQVMATWRPGEPFGTVNTGPGSARLAAGHSRQAANGWVDVAVDTALERFK